MTSNQTHSTLIWRNFILCVIGATAFMIVSSASAGDAPATPVPPSPTSAPAVPTGKLGVQLWAENCGRCHNIRAQNSLSPGQWEVAMLHMRVRANLTGEEARKILAFLKSGH